MVLVSTVQNDFVFTSLTFDSIKVKTGVKEEEIRKEISETIIVTIFLQGEIGCAPYSKSGSKW
jgi:hypothetical protein